MKNRKISDYTLLSKLSDLPIDVTYRRDIERYLDEMRQNPHYRLPDYEREMFKDMLESGGLPAPNLLTLVGNSKWTDNVVAQDALKCG